MKNRQKKSRTSCHLYDSQSIRTDVNYVFIIPDFGVICKGVLP